MAENSFGWDNWTGTGVNDADSLAAEIDRIKKWQRTHSGIDFSAAGPDYPHPSQRVRTLIFFEGNGRLDPTGIQFRTTGVTAKGLHWVPEFTDAPLAEIPSFQIRGDIQDPTGDPFVYSHIEAIATANDTADLQINAGDPSSSSLTGMFLDLGNSVISASLNAYVNPLVTADRALELTELPIYLVGKTSDFTSISDGMLWYRSDIDKFRARANGVTENLAFESSIPTTMNKQPFAAKTTTYVTTASDGVISVDASSASFTVTLVTAVGNAGLTQTFKKTTAANVVTIDASSTQTIDGALTYALSARYSWLTIVSDGANWLITGAG